MKHFHRRKSRLTQRAVDNWDSARFLEASTPQQDSVFKPDARPTQLPLTQAVGQPKSKTKFVFDSQISFCG